jgi:hypothetical protein
MIDVAERHPLETAVTVNHDGKDQTGIVQGYVQRQVNGRLAPVGLILSLPDGSYRSLVLRNEGTKECTQK